MLSGLNTLFLATALFCATQGLNAQNMNLDLKPNQDRVLNNSTLWTIHATCKIHGGTNKKTIKIKGTTNGSQINGKQIAVGKATSLTMYTDKTVDVIAEPGAQVTISNMSSEPLTAVCSS